MRKRFNAIAARLLRLISRNGTKSYSFAGIRFLTAADVKRIFPDCIVNEGQAEAYTVPAQEIGRTAFFLQGTGHSPEGLLRSYEVRLDAPFSARFQASERRKLFAVAGCLLVRDHKLGAFVISPEPTASRRVASPFRRARSESAASFLAISSWTSFGFGDFGLIMLPKLARLAAAGQRGFLMLPSLPYINQYLSIFQLEALPSRADSRQLTPIRDFAEVVFGPGVETAFVSLQSDIHQLRERVLPLLAKKTLPKKVYLCRGGLRRILNEEELLPLVKQLGFAIIEDNHTDVLEQAALFWHADFIISPHGALLANLMYCKPGTVLVELVPGSYAAICYRTLSHLAGVRYYGVFCTKLGHFRNEACTEDYRVDTDKLYEILKSILIAEGDPSDA